MTNELRQGRGQFKSISRLEGGPLDGGGQWRNLKRLPEVARRTA